VALIVGYRKARVEESASRRDDQRLFSDRYQDAAELLGHEKAARLAGVYAVARLADDWQDQQQQCIDVFCAYLRLPYDPHALDGEREVRLTVIRLITSHLTANAHTTWRGRDFDFTGVHLRGWRICTRGLLRRSRHIQPGCVLRRHRLFPIG